LHSWTLMVQHQWILCEKSSDEVHLFHRSLVCTFGLAENFVFWNLYICLNIIYGWLATKHSLCPLCCKTQIKFNILFSDFLHSFIYYKINSLSIIYSARYIEDFLTEAMTTYIYNFTRQWAYSEIFAKLSKPVLNYFFSSRTWYPGFGNVNKIIQSMQSKKENIMCAYHWF
jgi:hypothetical protein